MATRPDIQQKRDTALRLRTRDAKKMHEKAADLERMAATLAHSIAVEQAQMLSYMLEAAILRREARAK